MMITPKLTLLGAGPGDPELITLKAINRLKTADVILFDALVNKDLLRYTSESSKYIFVGKRAGHHHKTQDEINELIKINAFEHGHVVRLKGGDPFIFGRGWEEVSYAASLGIDVEVIPGISSAFGVPGINFIPLTTRGINESFWVITGSTSDEALYHDFNLAMRSNSTIVVLMGIGKLDNLISLIRNAGKATTPMAVIQNGSLPDQKMVVGTGMDIKEKVLAENIGTPAIIVIGPAVELRNSLPFLQRKTA